MPSCTIRWLNGDQEVIVSKRSLVLAAAGPVAVGAILAARSGDPSAIAAAPAIVFGVVAATSPALYIGITAIGKSPPLASVARAFVIALGAFGLALAGLVLPTAFLSLSSVAAVTSIAVCSCALAGAGALAMWRLHGELAARSFGSSVVFGIWAIATFGIAGRLWWDLASEVVS
jgi:hypothetical protein